MAFYGDHRVEIEVLHDWGGYGPEDHRPWFEWDWTRGHRYFRAGFAIRDRWVAVAWMYRV